MFLLGALCVLCGESSSLRDNRRENQC